MLNANAKRPKLRRVNFARKLLFECHPDLSNSVAVGWRPLKNVLQIGPFCLVCLFWVIVETCRCQLEDSMEDVPIPLWI